MSNMGLCVLFLCTGNSARSILAESILNGAGAGRFSAVSAGSHPKGQVHPLALQVLRDRGYATAGLRSKSWDEFATGSAAPIDVVITVCDNAAGETCPIWPGRPALAHWGIPDPAAAEGPDSEQRKAFLAAFVSLSARIEQLVQLPLETMGLADRQAALARIGRRE